MVGGPPKTTLRGLPLLLDDSSILTPGGRLLGDVPDRGGGGGNAPGPARRLIISRSGLLSEPPPPKGEPEKL